VPGANYNPQINPADFSPTVNNQYFPLPPGTTYVYQAAVPEGTRRVEVSVQKETKTILGVTCRVVRDRVTLNGALEEDTLDWYAQHRDGTVWYFGEDAKTYQNGIVVGTKGSWEGGVDGAKPGIVMEAHPAVGDRYRQEYLKDVAEDEAEVAALAESVTVPYGAFNACLRTRESTRLEPGVTAEKYYAPGVGQVLTVEGGVREELVSVTQP
jgi:hypothetical protein